MSTVYLTVVIPKTIKWDIERVLSFTRQLMINFGHLELSIIASQQDICWGIAVADWAVDGLVAALQSFYPGVQVSNDPDDEIDASTEMAQYWRYPIQAVNQFVAPLQSVLAFRAFDPLASVANAMAHAGQGELIGYELVLSRPSKDYHKEVERMFGPPSFLKSFAQGLIPQMFRPLPPHPETVRAEQEFMNLVAEKVQQPLMEVDFNLNVAASTEVRADHLAGTVATSFSQFDTEYNTIVFTINDGYPLVLCPAEVAALWHLPTFKTR